jgi:hypothetical protein
MIIPIEDLRRLIFHEKKSYDEIAKIYGITTNKLKKIINNTSLPVNRVKPCVSCKNNARKGPPPEGSGGMKFDLTKD